MTITTPKFYVVARVVGAPGSFKRVWQTPSLPSLEAEKNSNIATHNSGQSF